LKVKKLLSVINEAPMTAPSTTPTSTVRWQHHHLWYFRVDTGQHIFWSARLQFGRYHTSRNTNDLY